MSKLRVTATINVEFNSNLSLNWLAIAHVQYSFVILNNKFVFTPTALWHLL